MLEMVKVFIRQLFRIPYLLSDLHYRYYLNTIPRYLDEKRLFKYGHKVFSQNEEDGIILEILKRINVDKGYFVEFGVSNGLQNNTANLILNGWKGAWIEGSKKDCEKIARKFDAVVASGVLKLKNSLVTRENIVQLFEEFEVPSAFELLCIDIDGNDYWIMETLLKKYKPKIIVIEYNATYPPNFKWVMKYNAHHIWKHTSYFGASLKSLEELGSRMGYKLVGCNFTGLNAFFVHEDLIGDKFAGPFTAENHYEPPRYFVNFYSGHPSDFSSFESR